MSGIPDVKLAPSILAADFARLGEQVVTAAMVRLQTGRVYHAREPAEPTAL
jgi:hypothetical protein